MGRAAARGLQRVVLLIGLLAVVGCGVVRAVPASGTATAGASLTPLARTDATATANPASSAGFRDRATLGIVANPVEAAPKANPDSFSPGKEGQDLAIGDGVRAPGTGTGLVTYFEGTTTEVSPGTSIVVEELALGAGGARMVTVRQGTGIAVHRVGQLLAGGRFIVQTPGTAAVVRGTIVRSTVLPTGTTRMEAWDSPVDFTAAGVTVTIQPGQVSDGGATQPPTPPAPNAAPKPPDQPPPTIGAAQAAGTPTVPGGPGGPGAAGTAASGAPGAIGGPAVTATIAAPGQDARIAFSAAAGQRFFIRYGAGTFTLADSQVLGPDGRTSVAAGPAMGVNRSGDSNVITLAQAGTHTLVIAPRTNQQASAGSVSIQLVDVPPDPIIPASIGGPAVTAATTVPGQDARVTFSAAAGQRFFIRYGAGTFTLADSQVLAPDGRTSVAAGPAMGVNRSGDSNVITLARAGTHTLVISPRMNEPSSTGGIGVQLIDVPPDPIVQSSIGGAAVTAATTVPGQDARVTFSAAAGQRFFIRYGAGTFTLADSQVLGPDGRTSVAAGPAMGVNRSGDSNVITLPAAGAYTLVISPRMNEAASVGNVNVQLVEVPPDPTIQTSIGGGAVTAATSVPGQQARVTFAGTAGQRFFIRYGVGTFTLADSQVLGPDGRTSVAAGPAMGVNRSGDSNVITLPAAGTYTLVISPRMNEAVSTGNVSVQLVDVPADPITQSSIGGAAVTAATTVPGQDARVTFSAAAGQRLVVRYAVGTFTLADSQVLGPDGRTSVASGPAMGVNRSGDSNVISLPAAGTYTLVISPRMNEAVSAGSVDIQLLDAASVPASRPAA